MGGDWADAVLPLDHRLRWRLELAHMNLTPKQRALAIAAYRFPVILTNRNKFTAIHLRNKGLGTVEDGASGDVLFRLNQAGCDLVSNSFHNGEIAHD